MASADGVLGLSGAELDALPAPLAERIREQARVVAEELESLRREKQVIAIDAQQQCHDLEQRFIECSTELSRRTDELALLRQDVAARDTRLEVLALQLREAEAQLADRTAALERSSGSAASFADERAQLLAALERKNGDIDRLNEELRASAERVTESSRKQLELLSRIDELESNAVAAKFREQRLEQERDLARTQAAWCEGELKARSEELLAFRKEKAAQLVQLQGALDESTADVGRLTDQINDLRQRLNESQAQGDALREKLKEAKDELAQSEEQFRAEVATQTRLTGLYRTAADEAKDRAAQLAGAVEELKRLSEGARAEVEAAERRAVAEAERAAKEREALQERIERLEGQLGRANELLAAAGLGLAGDPGDLRGASGQPLGVGALSATAVAAAQMLREGMTLTEMYSELASTKDQLQAERDENRRLNGYLQQILREIEEKAPALHRQRVEYERAVQTVAQLTERMDTAVRECDRFGREAEAARAEASQLRRDRDRLEQRASDLGRQVQVLLRECEVARGGFPAGVDETGTAGGPVDAAGVIAERLVAFRSVAELQQRNAELLELVRTLGSEREQEELARASEASRDLERKLTAALGELDEMREARTRQQEMVTAIVRQRDMYRVLLVQATGTDPAVSSSASTVAAPAAAAADATPRAGPEGQAAGDGREFLAELRAEFEAYRREREETDKLSQESEEKLRADASEMRVRCARLEQEVEHLNERLKGSAAAAAAQAREIEALRARNAEFAQSVIEHQRTIERATAELLSSREEVRKLEVALSNSRAEKEMLRLSEERLQRETAELAQEKARQSQLLVALQEMQGTLERSDGESRRRLAGTIEALERECAVLRKRADGAVEEARATRAHLDAALAEARAQLEAEVRAHHADKELLVRAQCAEEAAVERARQLESRVEAGERRLMAILQQRTGGDHTQRADKAAQGGATGGDDLVREVESLREQLSSARQHAAQYKAIAAASEEALRDLNRTSAEYKEAMEAAAARAAEEIDALRRQIEGARQAQSDSATDLAALHEQAEAATRAHAAETAELRRRIADLEASSSTVAAREAMLRDEAAALRQEAAEAKDRYERELIVHAADVQALKELKTHAAELEQRLREAQSEAESTKAELRAREASWAERERVIVGDYERWEERVKGLQRQNDLLHAQLESVTAQATRIQQAAADAGAPVAADAGEGAPSTAAAGSADELRELVRFLRREKEICACQLELAQQEAARLRLQAENASRALNETRAELSAERARAPINAQTAQQQAELMERIGQMNLLRESNATLREELSRNVALRNALEAKVREFEAQILPLMEEKRALTAARDAALAESKATHNEITRWKQRVKQLADKSQRADPEELAAANARAEQAAAEAKSLREDVARLTADVERLTGELSAARADVEAKEAKATELEGKVKGVTRTAVRFRDENTKLKARVAELEAAGGATAAAAVPAGGATAEERQQLEQRIGDAEAARAAAEGATKEKDATVMKLTEDLKKARDMNRKIMESLTKQKTEKETLTQRIGEAESRVRELEARVAEQQASLAEAMRSAPAHADATQAPPAEQRGNQKRPRSDDAEEAAGPSEASAESAAPAVPAKKARVEHAPVVQQPHEEATATLPPQQAIQAPTAPAAFAARPPPVQEDAAPMEVEHAELGGVPSGASAGESVPDVPTPAGGGEGEASLSAEVPVDAAADVGAPAALAADAEPPQPRVLVPRVTTGGVGGPRSPAALRGTPLGARGAAAAGRRGRRGRPQVAPFTLTHSMSFTADEDSAVPSTPTLAVPHRTDAVVFESMSDVDMGGESRDVPGADVVPAADSPLPAEEAPRVAAVAAAPIGEAVPEHVPAGGALDAAVPVSSPPATPPPADAEDDGATGGEAPAEAHAEAEGEGEAMDDVPEHAAYSGEAEDHEEQSREGAGTQSLEEGELTGAHDDEEAAEAAPAQAPEEAAPRPPVARSTIISLRGRGGGGSAPTVAAATAATGASRDAGTAGAPPAARGKLIRSALRGAMAAASQQPQAPQGQSQQRGGASPRGAARGQRPPRGGGRGRAQGAGGAAAGRGS